MKNKHTIIRLLKYLFRYKLKITIILVLTVISNVLMIIAPDISGKAIDAMALPGGVDLPLVVKYCIIMIIFYVISIGISYVVALLFAAVGQQTSYDMRKEVFNKIITLPSKTLDEYQTGDLISRFTYDINLITTSLTHDLVQIITAIITVGGATFMMLKISPALLSMYLIIIPIEIFYVRYRSKVIRPLFRKRSKAIGRLCQYIEEKISGVKTIRAYSAQNHYCNEFADKNKETSDTQYEAEYAGSTIFPVMNFISNIALSFIALFGILLYIAKKISLGNISTFVLYSRKLLGSINEVSNIFSDLQSALAASERVFNLLDKDSEENAKLKANETPLIGDISISHLNFSYVPDKPILKDINLTIKQGKTIAVVGATGSGKTTLISILMRFYDINSGSITINNQDYFSMSRQHVRRGFAMVLQDTWLFNDTVYNNIAYGSKSVTKEQVIAAAKASNVHEIIMSMPNGYESVLSENAVNLSKGQKQLITIARAMVQDTPMVILDEATSNVDIATEALIHSAMERLLDNKTCFIIAHRLSTIVNADNILVLSDGEIVEQGTHSELLSKNGAYSKMYNSQFD